MMEVGGENRSIRAFQRPRKWITVSTASFYGWKELIPPLEKDVASGMWDVVTEVAEYENRDNAIDIPSAIIRRRW
ncbi:MAG: hypothetical protein ACLT16_11645 [[Clostridium] innocuum]